MVIKCIYFDLDDTLINTTQIFKKEFEKSNFKFSEAIKNSIKSYKDVSLDKIYSKVNKIRLEIINKYGSNYPNQFDDILSQLDIKYNEQLISVGVTSYHIEKQKQLSYDESLYNFLKKISKHYKIGILSDGMALKQWDKINYVLGHKQDIFTKENVIISGIFGIGKTSDKIFYELLRREKFNPEEILYVGDKYEKDIKRPNNLGFKTAFINNKKMKSYIKDVKNLDPKPDFILESIYDLEDVDEIRF